MLPRPGVAALQHDTLDRQPDDKTLPATPNPDARRAFPTRHISRRSTDPHEPTRHDAYRLQ